MANETQASSASAAEQKSDAKVETKVIRRGVGTARGPQRLKFNHTDATPKNGLFIGHLDSVVLGSMKIGEDTTGMPSFNGMEIPKLVLTFASNELDAAKRKYVTLQFNAVESNVETIPNGKSAWKVDSIMDWFKHLVNVYLLKGAREMTDEEVAALSLNFEDFDEQGQYVPVEPEVVIAGWKTLFENFENIFNHGKDGNPIFKTKDGKYIPIWMKLLRFIKRKNNWSAVLSGNQAGELAFPAFVGQGCIEILKQNEAPSIHINAMTESILPREINQPKAPNMNPIAGGIPIGGVPVSDMPYDGGMGADVIATEAAEDLPF